MTKIAVLTAQGANSLDAERARSIAASAAGDVDEIRFDRSANALTTAIALTRTLTTRRDQLIYLEGTGLRVGIPLIIANAISQNRVRYIVSSGDAVDRFIRNRYGLLAGWIARIYEKLLYSRSIAFVGWTPYLVGRAIRMGAPTGLTIEGQVPPDLANPTDAERAKARRTLGLADHQIAIGVTGSINWSRRQRYAYGLELIEAAARAHRSDVRYFIMGDGTGLSRLRSIARHLDTDIVFTGKLPRRELWKAASALDLAVVSQTPDEVGLLRLTTKLPEYLALGVPVAMPASPGVLDYLSAEEDSPAIVLPPSHPGRRRYWEALAREIDALTKQDLARRRTTALSMASQFRETNPGYRLRTLLTSLQDLLED